MRINIIAVGKIKEKYFSDALDEYVKRASRFAEIRVTEVPEAPQGKSVAERRALEGASLMSKARGAVVLTDIGGEELSSDRLAEFIQKKGVGGVSEISFLIGGSDGCSDELKASVDMRISFGKNTFPHQLFRVMLAEQIYRALTIINGVKYHK